MKPFALVTAASLVTVLMACSPSAEKPADKAEKPAKKVVEAGCPDDGPRLPGTGICQGRVANYFDPARLQRPAGDPPEGCSYRINETMTPDPAEAILYNALSCKGKTTKLEMSIGARSASLGYGVSGFFEKVPAAGEEGSEIVRMFRLEGVADPKAMILDMAKGLAKEEKVNAAEIAACEIRPAGEGYPSDAFLVDVSDAYQKARKIGAHDPVKEGPDAGVYAACGSFGITGASGDFWLIRDGYAWFVRQGQDVADFDAGSLTVFRKTEKGGWGPAQ